jgi:hypothetical protein
MILTTGLRDDERLVARKSRRFEPVSVVRIVPLVIYTQPV